MCPLAEEEIKLFNTYILNAHAYSAYLHNFIQNLFRYYRQYLNYGQAL